MKQASCQNIDLFQTDFGETVLAKQPLESTRAHNNVRSPSSFPFANVSRALIFSQDSRSHKSGGVLETIALIPIAGYI